MITSEQIDKFRNAMEDAAGAGMGAVHRWGAEIQTAKAREEMGELLVALSRREQGELGHRPDRATDADVVDEAADVIITAIQIGIIYCDGPEYTLDDLIAAIAYKAARLRHNVTLSQREVAGG